LVPKQGDATVAVAGKRQVQVAVAVEIGGTKVQRRGTGRVLDRRREGGAAGIQDRVEVGVGVVHRREIEPAIAVEVGHHDPVRRWADSAAHHGGERTATLVEKVVHVAHAGRGHVEASVSIQIAQRELHPPAAHGVPHGGSERR